MTPKLNAGEAVHNPGPLMRGLLADIGWSVPGQDAPIPEVRVTGAVVGGPISGDPVVAMVTSAGGQVACGQGTVSNDGTYVLTLGGAGVADACVPGRQLSFYFPRTRQTAVETLTWPESTATTPLTARPPLANTTQLADVARN
jgi:hypothetical protein